MWGSSWGSWIFFGPTDHLKKFAKKVAALCCKNI